MAELTSLEASRVCDVHRDTAQRWCRDGLIKARRVGLRGDWRIDLDDLRRHARQYGYDFDEELAEKLARN